MTARGRLRGMGAALALLLSQGAAAAQPAGPHAFVPLDEPDVGPWTFVDLASVRAANADPLSSARYADIIVLGLDPVAGQRRRSYYYRIMFSCTAPWLRPLTRMEVDADGRPMSPMAPADAVARDDLPIGADIRTVACGPLPLQRPQNASPDVAAAIAYRGEHSEDRP